MRGCRHVRPAVRMPLARTNDFVNGSENGFETRSGFFPGDFRRKNLTGTKMGKTFSRTM